METGEFEADTVTSQGDFIAKGTKVTRFEGFFANGERVDELTLYHLAGDAERRDEIIAYRETSASERRGHPLVLAPFVKSVHEPSLIAPQDATQWLERFA